MMHSTTIKIILVLFLLNTFGQLFAQTNETGIVKGKIINPVWGHGIPSLSVFIELSAEEKISTKSNDEGLFEIEVPAGERILNISNYGYENYTKKLMVAAGDTLEHEIIINLIGETCPWHSSKPYPELRGLWEPIYYINGSDTIDQSINRMKSSMTFFFSDDTLTGRFDWYDGCNTCDLQCLNHIGDRVIEFKGDKLVECTIKGCSDYDEVLTTFIRNMFVSKTKTNITNNGQFLELVLGKEKYVLKKIHDNTHPDLSAELLGSWMPVEGNMNGKTIRKFDDKAEVVFGRRSDISQRTGSVQYKDGATCGSKDEDMELVYQYLDEDFISIRHIKLSRKAEICKTKFLLGVLLRNISGGCTIKFNEAKDVATLQYDENYLELKRKE